jgi:hypothetical protein
MVLILIQKSRAENSEEHRPENPSLNSSSPQMHDERRSKIVLIPEPYLKSSATEHTFLKIRHPSVPDGLTSNPKLNYNLVDPLARLLYQMQYLNLSPSLMCWNDGNFDKKIPVHVPRKTSCWLKYD